MIPALVVYALAEMTLFAVLWEHALSDSDKREFGPIVLLVFVSCLWPLYAPAIVIDKAFAARGGR